MLDALTQAYGQIHNTIPREVLEAAFEPFNNPDMTLDELIRQKVIVPRLLEAVSARSGKLCRIILQLDWCDYTSAPSPYALGISGSYTTYKIPPEAREHRDISCVVQIRFPYQIGTSASGNFYNNCSMSGTTVGQLACAALQSQTGSNQLVYPTAQVLPGNVIKLDPPQFNWVPWAVMVRLKFDENFSGMDVSSLRTFAQLCEYAVKAYCYNQLIFKVESNLVFRGVELGVMKDIVNSYSEANERFEEFLLAFQGAQTYEPDQLDQILRYMVPK